MEARMPSKSARLDGEPRYLILVYNSQQIEKVVSIFIKNKYF